MTYSSSKHALILLLLVSVMTAPSAWAQSTNAQISGLVMDSSGASVPGAAVKATNTATNVEYSTVSNEAGVYVIPQLRDATLALRLSNPFELAPGPPYYSS